MTIKSKKLTLATVKKNHAQTFNEKTKITLSNGDFLHIQTKFKNTSIQRLLVDYIDILEQIKNKKLDFNIIKDITFVYYILLLRHFTDLDNIPIEIDKMVIVCEELINLDLLEEIMSAFPPSELEKVQRAIEKISENSKILGNQFGDIFAKFAIDEALKGDESDGL